MSDGDVENIAESGNIIPINIEDEMRGA